MTWLSVVCIYAHVCSRLGDRDAARTLYALLEPWRDQVAVSVVAWGSVAHYLGMLAAAFEDFDAAERHLDQAQRVHEQMSAPVWSAQTRLETGRLLAARGAPGEVAQARGLVGDALERSHELGSERIGRDARELLAAMSQLKAG